MKNIALIITLTLSFNILAAGGDPLIKNQWWLGYSQEGIGANIIGAWKIARQKYKVRVAIIDSGIDMKHPDLRNRISINRADIPNNGIDDDKNGYIDDHFGLNVFTMKGNAKDMVPDGDHGTHVAGIVGAQQNNGIGIAGVASNVELINVQVFMTGEQTGYSHIAKAIDYAIARGAHIMNLSLGGGARDPQVEKAVQRARAKGIFMAIAAGNESQAKPSFPAAYGGFINKQTGKDLYPNVMAIAASTKQKMMAVFSNHHATKVHVFAPGTKILSSIRGGKYDSFNGTSMATPVVAGIAALVVSHNGPRSLLTMKARLMNTSRRFQTLSGKVLSNGLVNAHSALTGQMTIPFTWEKIKNRLPNDRPLR